MIPDPHAVSAFAFYNGLAGKASTRNRRRRRSSAKRLNDTSPKSKSVSESSDTHVEEAPVIFQAVDRTVKSPLTKRKSKNSKIVNRNESFENIIPVENSHILNSSESSNVLHPIEVSPVASMPKAKKKNSLKEKGKLVKAPPFEVSSTDIDNTHVKAKKRSILQTVHNRGNTKKSKFSVELDDMEHISSSNDVHNVNSSSPHTSKETSLKTSAKSRSQSRKNTLKKKSEKDENFRQAVQESLKNKIGSPDVGKKVLETILSPTSVNTFFKMYWEKKPLLIQRNQSSYFKKYLSIKDIDDMLRYNALMFTKNIDITSYSNGERETHNPVGRAHPHVVWDYYSNGCSVRILNPQTYLHKIHMLLSALQEFFGCFVGSNVYLTPPNSQGFAPHYDDIEAFVLQIEGSKRWRVYAPRSEDEALPRYSSPNFSGDEIGEPILDVTLKPGDLLYFPRGFIHQAETIPNEHSLHITLSAYQKNSWIDLMEKAMPKALDEAWKHDIEFRKGLPMGYLNKTGFGYPGYSASQDLHIKMKKLISLLEKHLDVDAAVDAMGVRFMHEALPPVLSKEESQCSINNGGIIMNENAQLTNRVELQKNTLIRLLRANCCRLVEEIVEGEGLVAKLYTTVENSKVFEEEEPQFLIVPRELVPGVQRLLSSYPSFIPINNLPIQSEESRLILANDLWERGILLTDKPLSSLSDISSEGIDSD